MRPVIASDRISHVQMRSVGRTVGQERKRKERRGIELVSFTYFLMINMQDHSFYPAIIRLYDIYGG